jgi:hypothetical protein
LALFPQKINDLIDLINKYKLIYKQLSKIDLETIINKYLM